MTRVELEGPRTAEGRSSLDAMPEFLERYLLPLVVSLTTLIVFTNPMSFDWTQRITGGLVLVFGAYFAAHTIHKMNRLVVVDPARQTVLSGPTGSAGLVPPEAKFPPGPRWQRVGDPRIDEILEQLNDATPAPKDGALWKILSPLFDRDAFNPQILEGDWDRAFFVYAKTRQIISAYRPSFTDPHDRDCLKQIEDITADLHNEIGISYRQFDPKFSPDEHSERYLDNKSLFLSMLPQHRVNPYNYIPWNREKVEIEDRVRELNTRFQVTAGQSTPE